MGRVAAFAVGFGLAFGLLALFTFVTPGFWLPALYGGCAAALLLIHFERPLAPVGSAGAACLVLGVLMGYASTSPRASLTEFPAFTNIVGFALPAMALVSASVLAWGVTRLPMPRRKAVLPYVLLIAASFVVSYVSGDRGGADPMMALFADLGLTVNQAEWATRILRKTVHFGAYGFVAAFAWTAAYHAGLARGAILRVAFLFPLLLACFDEGRQLGTWNRTGSGWDVLLDMAGAATFVFVLEKRASQPSRAVS